ncbi:diaminopimelate epimerase [Kitasatospora sp. NPDC059160]|uniref:diaminopimelate epimerase n=1 Tax=Kitasatospora sp. NPDC059160 TaxID=3346748 RepID=UPI003682F04B
MRRTPLSTPFRKIHGAGNDFVLLNGADQDTGRDWHDIAVRLCARRTGIGADGLVVSTLISSAPPVLEVSCFNADGSIATMCGNALRCSAWAAAEDFGFDTMTLVMAGVEHEATVTREAVAITAEVGAVDMRVVESVWGGRPFWFDSAHTGTEHVVAVVNDVDGLDAEACGRLMRHHPKLAPLGANVNFVESIDRQTLKIRTYERGVEAETLSCGSGAVAAVVIAGRRGLVTAGPVAVHNRAGTPLTVAPHADRPAKSYWVAGPVTLAYEGVIS